MHLIATGRFTEKKTTKWAFLKKSGFFWFQTLDFSLKKTIDPRMFNLCEKEQKGILALNQKFFLEFLCKKKS